MARKFVKAWNYKVGYQVRYEELSGDEAGGGPAFVMRSAFTPDGAYIGSPKVARFLIKKNGVKPELANEGDNVCTIGFRSEDQKWYGWSHRAMCGFGLGDKLYEEDWPEGTEQTPFIRHGAVTIESLSQAREAAVNFADSVG